MSKIDEIANGKHHKRTGSSVLKSIIGPRNHRRNPSAGDALPSQMIYDENHDPQPYSNTPRKTPVISDGQSAFAQLPLGEMVQNQLTSPSQPTTSICYEHTRTNSSTTMGLPWLMNKPGQLIKQAQNPSEKPSKIQGSPEKPPKPKKSKSYTSLGAFLSRPKSSKGPKGDDSRGRQHVREQSTAPDMAPTPIYAQFASRPFQQESQSTTVPLNDTQIQAEISRYTPVNYSPSKQRNFNEDQRPTLARRIGRQKARPKSEFLPSTTSGTVFGDALEAIRRTSNEVTRQNNSSQGSFDGKRRPHSFWGGRADGPTHEKKEERKSSDERGRPSSDGQKDRLAVANRGSRVMAAVAAFNMKAKEAESEMATESGQSIESSFEALLDSRNVPQNMREKLRSLDARIKADFIKQDKSENHTAAGVGLLSSSSTTTTLDTGGTTKKKDRLGSDDNAKSPKAPRKSQKEDPSESPRKRSRPRSKTFSLHRSDKSAGSSPSKKQKSDDGHGPPRTASVDFGSSLASSKSQVATRVADALTVGIGSRSQPAVPDDFVRYLKQVRRPQEVEVGKLHKLRLVLRNERVAWVDQFISMGGMMEVVGLLKRIMAVEWREEHEDALLHEVLLCLKALCTTKLALRELDGIQSTLFPALVSMIFDEEKKGPSEFTTRGIVFSLLLTYLSDGPTPVILSQRANFILSYLRDAGPPESAQPPGFIQSMHQPRPYRMWCKEIVSITKEVFWIFLHQMNVIPIIQPSAADDDDDGNDEAGKRKAYHEIHFPKERPPVPAAPYVGGVEWEATNYIASHLDLLNGLIASLPSCHQRNSLREELRMSGFEKVMAGSLRTCKEKFYGAVHDGLKTWVAAAVVDRWSVEHVRGPIVHSGSTTTSTTSTGPAKVKSPVKHGSPAKNGKVVVDDTRGFPRLELNLDLNSGSATAAAASRVEGLGEDGARWMAGESPTGPKKNKKEDIDIDTWVY